MKKLIALFFSGAVLFACNNSTQSPGNGKNKADSLFDEVMEGHNVAMARMGRLEDMKKTVQAVLDSISRLPANAQKSTAEYRIQMDSVLQRLGYTEYAMNKWMQEFDIDSAKNDLNRRIEYLESEKIKINKVKESILGSLTRADSLLHKK